MSDADEVVVTSGRRMTRNLERALDDCTTDREVIIRALTEPSQRRLAAINHAIALELRLCQLREQHVLDGLRDD